MTTQVLREFREEYADGHGIAVLAAGKLDASQAGIHLLNPSIQELHDALLTALRDGFKAIYVYTNRTWLR